jgi:hypothetical protein
MVNFTKQINVSWSSIDMSSPSPFTLDLPYIHKCYQWQWVEVSSVQGAGISGTTDRSELELQTWL